MKNRNVVSLALLVGTLCLLTGCEQSTNRTPSDIVPAEEAEQCNRTVVFVADGVSPTEVRMAADFESPPWNGGIVLRDDERDGFWTADISLPEGSFSYRFIVDGEWQADPFNPTTELNEFGQANSVALHTCPFTPVCLTDAECTNEEAPLCRFYTCVDASTAPCVCDDGSSCDADGNCPEPEPEPDCSATDPCPGSQVCRDGVCGPECFDDSDCTGSDLCIDLECVAPECSTEFDCDDFLSQDCQSQFCVEQSCAEQNFLFYADAGAFSSVHVAGSFNATADGSWPGTIAAGGLALTYLESLGAWYGTLEIADGSYQYKFVLNETDWVSDPLNSQSSPDGFGGINSVLNISCGGGTGDSGGTVSSCGDPTEFQWEDSVMYFVMVDRFYDSDNYVDLVDGVEVRDAANGPSGQYVGGDIPGVEAKLPYLSDLGVSAIWLSAPYDNRDYAGGAIDTNQDGNTYSAYHGYWPSPLNTDYSDPNNPSPRPLVESRIGSDASLRSFVDAAHGFESTTGDGIKVLFDYVMNHVDSASQLYQAHPEWFATDNGRIRLCGPENLWSDPYWGTRCAFTDYLPPFDFYNDEARAWSIADAIWWAKEYNLDGYRLDAIKHVPLSWLTDLRQALNEEFTDPAGGRFYLVGETFDYGNRDLLKSFVDPNTMLDGQFDFPFKAQACSALFSKEQPMSQFAYWMDGNDGYYGPGALMSTWIGNHDIPRAIHFASGQIGNCMQGSWPGNAWTSDFAQPTDAPPYERLSLSFAIMMTNGGVPLIYYGDEIGLAGGGDPDNRRAMPWDESALNDHQKALRADVRALSRLRAEHRVLARGQRQTVHADSDTWVYKKTGCGSGYNEAVVAINRADSSRSVPIPNGSWVNAITGESVSAGAYTLDARDFLVLVSAN